MDTMSIHDLEVAALSPYLFTRRIINGGNERPARHTHERVATTEQDGRKGAIANAVLAPGGRYLVTWNYGTEPEWKSVVRLWDLGYQSHSTPVIVASIEAGVGEYALQLVSVAPTLDGHSLIVALYMECVQSLSTITSQLMTFTPQGISSYEQ